MARTATELRTAIAEIEAKLDSGISKTVIDGTTVEINSSLLERRLTQLRRELESVDATTKARRPVAARIDLGGF